ncbi:MAG: ParB N-terminal domain-containing protein [Treponema sp.]|jgi:hypothetical protein|nr:ParB N-terminal domain-containing protein [Treponema sp.]
MAAKQKPSLKNEEAKPESKTIAIKCKAAEYIPWRSIKPLQGNYKKRSNDDIKKLANLIIKRGIRFPSFISKIGKDIWAIDTHGRLLAYEFLESIGYQIPNVPVAHIEAKDKAEAKQLLLECDSRYGHVTREGYAEFIEGIVVETEDLSLEIKIEETESREIAYKEKIELIIDCKDEFNAAQLYNEFKERGLKCRISTL